MGVWNDRILRETTGIGDHFSTELETQCKGYAKESRRVTLVKTLSNRGDET